MQQTDDSAAAAALQAHARALLAKLSSGSGGSSDHYGLLTLKPRAQGRGAYAQPSASPSPLGWSALAKAPANNALAASTMSENPLERSLAASTVAPRPPRFGGTVAGRLAALSTPAQTPSASFTGASPGQQPALTSSMLGGVASGSSAVDARTSGGWRGGDSASAAAAPPPQRGAPPPAPLDLETLRNWQSLSTPQQAQSSSGGAPPAGPYFVPSSSSSVLTPASLEAQQRADLLARLSAVRAVRDEQRALARSYGQRIRQQQAQAQGQRAQTRGSQVVQPQQSQLLQQSQQPALQPPQSQRVGGGHPLMVMSPTTTRPARDGARARPPQRLTSRAPPASAWALTGVSISNSAVPPPPGSTRFAAPHFLSVDNDDDEEEEEEGSDGHVGMPSRGRDKSIGPPGGGPLHESTLRYAAGEFEASAQVASGRTARGEDERKEHVEEREEDEEDDSEAEGVGYTGSMEGARRGVGAAFAEATAEAEAARLARRHAVLQRGREKENESAPRSPSSSSVKIDGMLSRRNSSSAPPPGSSPGRDVSAITLLQAQMQALQVQLSELMTQQQQQQQQTGGGSHSPPTALVQLPGGSTIEVRVPPRGSSHYATVRAAPASSVEAVESVVAEEGDRVEGGDVPSAAMAEMDVFMSNLRSAAAPTAADVAAEDAANKLAAAAAAKRASEREVDPSHAFQAHAAIVDPNVMAARILAEPFVAPEPVPQAPRVVLHDTSIAASNRTLLASLGIGSGLGELDVFAGPLVEALFDRDDPFSMLNAMAAKAFSAAAADALEQEGATPDVSPPPTAAVVAPELVPLSSAVTTEASTTNAPQGQGRGRISSLALPAVTTTSLEEHALEIVTLEDMEVAAAEALQHGTSIAAAEQNSAALRADAAAAVAEADAALEEAAASRAALEAASAAAEEARGARLSPDDLYRQAMSLLDALSSAEEGASSLTALQSAHAEAGAQRSALAMALQWQQQSEAATVAAHLAALAEAGQRQTAAATAAAQMELEAVYRAQAESQAGFAAALAQQLSATQRQVEVATAASSASAAVQQALAAAAEIVTESKLAGSVQQRTFLSALRLQAQEERGGGAPLVELSGGGTSDYTDEFESSRKSFGGTYGDDDFEAESVGGGRAVAAVAVAAAPPVAAPPPTRTSARPHIADNGEIPEDLSGEDMLPAEVSGGQHHDDSNGAIEEDFGSHAGSPGPTLSLSAGSVEEEEAIREQGSTLPPPPPPPQQLSSTATTACSTQPPARPSAANGQRSRKTSVAAAAPAAAAAASAAAAPAPLSVAAGAAAAGATRPLSVADDSDTSLSSALDESTQLLLQQALAGGDDTANPTRKGHWSTALANFTRDMKSRLAHDQAALEARSGALKAGLAAEMRLLSRRREVAEAAAAAASAAAAVPGASAVALKAARAASREVLDIAEASRRCSTRFHAHAAELSRHRADTRVRYHRELLAFQKQVAHVRRLQTGGSADNSLLDNGSDSSDSSLLDLSAGGGNGGVDASLEAMLLPAPAATNAAPSQLLPAAAAVGGDNPLGMLELLLRGIMSGLSTAMPPSIAPTTATAGSTAVTAIPQLAVVAPAATVAAAAAAAAPHSPAASVRIPTSPKEEVVEEVIGGLLTPTPAHHRRGVIEDVLMSPSENANQPGSAASSRASSSSYYDEDFDRSTEGSSNAPLSPLTASAPVTASAISVTTAPEGTAVSVAASSMAAPPLSPVIHSPPPASVDEDIGSGSFSSEQLSPFSASGARASPRAAAATPPPLATAAAASAINDAAVAVTPAPPATAAAPEVEDMKVDEELVSRPVEDMEEVDVDQLLADLEASTGVGHYTVAAAAGSQHSGPPARVEAPSAAAPLPHGVLECGPLIQGRMPASLMSVLVDVDVVEVVAVAAPSAAGVRGEEEGGFSLDAVSSLGDSFEESLQLPRLGDSLEEGGEDALCRATSDSLAQSTASGSNNLNTQQQQQLQQLSSSMDGMPPPPFLTSSTAMQLPGGGGSGSAGEGGGHAGSSASGGGGGGSGEAKRPLTVVAQANTDAKPTAPGASASALLSPAAAPGGGSGVGAPHELGAAVATPLIPLLSLSPRTPPSGGALRSPGTSVSPAYGRDDAYLSPSAASAAAAASALLGAVGIHHTAFRTAGTPPSPPTATTTTTAAAAAVVAAATSAAPAVPPSVISPISSATFEMDDDDLYDFNAAGSLPMSTLRGIGLSAAPSIISTLRLASTAAVTIAPTGVKQQQQQQSQSPAIGRRYTLPPPEPLTPGAVWAEDALSYLDEVLQAASARALLDDVLLALHNDEGVRASAGAAALPVGLFLELERARESHGSGGGSSAGERDDSAGGARRIEGGGLRRSAKESDEALQMRHKLVFDLVNEELPRVGARHKHALARFKLLAASPPHDVHAHAAAVALREHFMASLRSTMRTTLSSLGANIVDVAACEGGGVGVSATAIPPALVSARASALARLDMRHGSAMSEELETAAREEAAVIAELVSADILNELLAEECDAGGNGPGV